MKKRILSMLLAIVMVVGLAPGMTLTASAAEYPIPTGYCNNAGLEAANIAFWELSNDGTLTIKKSPSGGTGMGDFAGVPANRPSWETYKDQIKKVVIEDDITSLGSHAFYQYTALEEVVIGDGLSTIPLMGFYGCTKLSNVTIGSSVKKINGSAFNGCTSLENVTIPEGVTTLSSQAFLGCSITEITIPASVTTIEGMAFNGTSLTKVTYLGTTDPGSSSNNVFPYINQAYPTIHVPAEYIGTKFCGRDVTKAELTTDINPIIVETTPAEGGSVAVSVNGDSTDKAEKDAVVTITVTENKGYVLKSLTVTDADDGNVVLTNNGDTYTFTMPAKAVVVKAVFKEDSSLVYVGGTLLTVGDYYKCANNMLTSGGTADDYNAYLTFDEATGYTLNIKNLTVSGVQNTYYGAGIYSANDDIALTINFSGTNTINGAGNETNAAIYSLGDLNITGSGMLTANGSATTSNNSIKQSFGVGVADGKEINITDANEVHVSAGDVNLNPGLSQGLRASKILIENSIVYANGGQSFSQFGFSEGIAVVSGALRIKGTNTRVEAISGDEGNTKSGISGNGGSNTLYLENGFLRVEGKNAEERSYGIVGISLDMIGGVFESTCGTATNATPIANPPTIAEGLSIYDSGNNIINYTNDYNIFKNYSFVRIAPSHTHNWTYSLQTDTTNTITATCSDITCTADGGSMTIHAPAGYTPTTPLVYNGDEQKATLTGSFTTGDDFAADNAITITYDKTPINVGEYTASINVGGTTANVYYSIKQKDVLIKANDQTISYGESLDTNAVTPDGLVASHTVDSVTLTPSITNVGTGTITPSAAKIMNGAEDVTDNYDITYVDGNLTINQSQPAIAFKDYAPGRDYNGQALANPAAEQMELIGVQYSDVTFVWYKDSVADANKLDSAPSDAGTYYVVASVVETQNTKAASATSSAITISPLNISTAKVTLGDALTYNGSEQKQTVAEVKVGGLTVDAYAYEVTNNTAINAGTEYELTITAEENSNFTGSVTANFSIARKEVTVSAGTLRISKIYDGTIGAGALNGEPVVSGILAADGDVSVTVTPPAYTSKDVGAQDTIDVALTLEGDTNNNYVLALESISVPCEIFPLPISIAGAVVYDKDYDGTDAAEVTSVTFNDVVTGETLAIGTDYTVTSAVFPDANADEDNQTVTISVVLTDSTKANNYNLTNGEGFAIANAAKINKIDYHTITADTTVRANKAQTDLTFDLTDKLNGIDGAAIKSVAYGSNEKNLLAGSPSANGKIVTYHVNNGTAVGDTGVIEVTVSSTNYKDFVVAVTITTTDKNTLTITGVKMDAETYTYGGAAVGYDNSALSVTGTIGVAFDNNDLEYVYSGTLADGSTYAESTVAPTKAGTYTLTIRVPADNLDYTGKQEISFTIGTKTITRPAQASAVVYNGAEQTYGVVSTTEYTVTGGVQKNANENGHDVTITLTDKFNTMWDNGTTDDLTHKFIINKKAIIITADDKEAYAGSRQPELTYTVDGLIGSDKLITEPTLTTDANMNHVGTYTITASGADAGSNYTISYVNGTLRVEMFFFPIITLKYDVEIADDITDGEVSASKKLAYKGDTITIIVTPDAEYELTDLTVTDSRGNVIAVAKVSDTIYTFKMPGYDVEIDAAFAKIETPAPADPTVDCPRDWTCPMYGYADLDRTAWYHDGVHFAIENGLMQGVGNNQFNPNGTTTRAMIVTILWRLEGSPVVNYAMDFEDVAADQWYTEAIRWAASEKIVEGYGNGKFGTNDPITREQLVTIMFRYAKYNGYDVSVGENTNILSYDDAFDVAEWAIPAMQWACGSGMIQGIADGNMMNLAPQGNATRAQAATILYRFVVNVIKED